MPCSKSKSNLLIWKALLEIKIKLRLVQLKLFKNYKGSKMMSNLPMLRSKQPLTEHKVDLVFFKYIENDL